MKGTVSFTNMAGQIITEDSAQYVTPESFFRIGEKVWLIGEPYTVKDIRVRIFRSTLDMWVDIFCEPA